MVPGGKDEVQEDRGLPNLRQTEERVPDLYAGSGVRSSSTGIQTRVKDPDPEDLVLWPWIRIQYEFTDSDPDI